MEKLSENNELKGQALKAILKQRGLTQLDFAALARYKRARREMISKWIRGQSWPEALEPHFEELLDLPRGFFAAIGSGVPFNEALHALPTNGILHPPEHFAALEKGIDRVELARAVEHVARLFGVHVDNEKFWTHIRNHLLLLNEELRIKYPTLDTSKPLRGPVVHDIIAALHIILEELRSGLVAEVSEKTKDV